MRLHPGCQAIQCRHQSPSDDQLNFIETFFQKVLKSVEVDLHKFSPECSVSSSGTAATTGRLFTAAAASTLRSTIYHLFNILIYRCFKIRDSLGKLIGGQTLVAKRAR
jgi:hypothetical protein